MATYTLVTYTGYISRGSAVPNRALQTLQPAVNRDPPPTVSARFLFPDFPTIGNNRFQISVPRLVGIRHWELHLFRDDQILKRNFMQNGGGGASPTLTAS